MATKNKNEYPGGITIEVDGEVIGKIKEWKPEPVDEKVDWPEKYTDFIKKGVPSSGCDSNMHQISFPVGSLPELWGKEIPIQILGKSTLALTALGKLLKPGHLYIRSQLDMWGLGKTGQVCENCLLELTSTLEEMGYRVWFGVKPRIDEEWAESCGVVVCDYKLSYERVGDPDGPVK